MSAWSGIRPLATDPDAQDTASASRDHVVSMDTDGMITIAGCAFRPTVFACLPAPLLSFPVYLGIGGKLYACLCLAACCCTDRYEAAAAHLMLA